MSWWSVVFGGLLVMSLLMGILEMKWDRMDKSQPPQYWFDEHPVLWCIVVKLECIRRFHHLSPYYEKTSRCLLALFKSLVEWFRPEPSFSPFFGSPEIIPLLVGASYQLFRWLLPVTRPGQRYFYLHLPCIFQVNDFTFPFRWDMWLAPWRK